MNLGCLPTARRAYLPHNFNPSGLGRRADCASWLVGNLYEKQRLRSKRDEPADTYFPMYSKLLRRILPRRTYRTEIIDPLIARGDVEEDRSYRASEPGSPFGYSKGFRLAEQYRHGDFKTEILTDNHLVRNLERQRLAAMKAITAPVHRHLFRMLHRLDMAPNFPTPYMPLAMIAKRDHDHRFTICQQGRVHTLLTCLKKEYRQYLRFEGEPLYGIDITNSQPLILGLTLSSNRLFQSDDFQEYLRAIQNCSNAQANDGRQHTQTNNPNPTHHYVVTFDQCLNDDGLNDGYLDVCLSGRAYESLMDDSGYDRDGVKEHFFGVVYGEPMHGNTRVGRAFQERFPECWKRISRLKEGDLSILPRTMQTIESYLVIWRTCGRIAREMPDAPIATIHDNLVTTAPHLDAFKRILLDEFRSVFGVEPKTDTKPFAAD